MEQPSTSAESNELHEVSLQNVGPETTKLLNRIVWKLKQEQNSTGKSISVSNPISRAARYTGMHKSNIEKLLAFGDHLCFENKDIDRQIIHKELVYNYLVKRQIPTIAKLFNELHDKLPLYVDISYFIKILIKMGYVFYKFPGKQALYVMEKKTVTFERYNYLKSVKQYRKTKLPIVYIGFASVSRSLEVLNLEKTLQTDADNIINHILFTATGRGIKNIKVIPAASDETLIRTIKDWLLEILVVKDLEAKSVCVFEDSKIFQETLIDVPTWRSVKEDMVEWLEANNIPCAISMPKSDLLQLVEACTDTKKNTFILDHMLEIHKYSSLRLPLCINGLSVATLFVRYLNSNDYFKEFDRTINTNVTLTSPSEDLLRIFSNHVIQGEIKQLKEDMRLDNIIDEVIQGIKTSESIANTDCDEDESFFNFTDSD